MAALSKISFFLKNNTLLRSSLVVFALTALGGAINYLCQLLMSRTLSLEDFGTVNTIFSFLLVVSAPGTTLSTFTSKNTSQLHLEQKTEELSFYFSRIFIYICAFIPVFAALFYIFSPQLFQLFNTQNSSLVFYVFLYAMICYYISLLNGFFSGTKSFLILGVISLFLPVFKMLGIFSVKHWTESSLSPLELIFIFMNIGALLSIFFGYYKVPRHTFSLRPSKKHFQLMNRQQVITSLMSFAVTFLLLLFVNLDILLLKIKFGATQAGLYSAALLFGRVIYFFVSSLVTVMVPNLAGHKGSLRHQFGVLNQSLLMTILLIFVFLLPVNLFSEFFVQIIFGQKFMESAAYLLPASCIALTTSILTLLMNYAFVSHGLRFFLLNIAVGVGLLVTFLSQSDSSEFVSLMAVAAAGLLLCLINYCYFRYLALRK